MERLERDSATATKLGEAAGELGMAYAAFHLREATLAALRNARALTDDPRWPYYEAIVLEQLGRWTEAAAALEETLQRSPGSRPAALRLTRIHVRSREFREAAELLSRMSQDREPGAAEFELAAELAYERSDFDAAVRLYRETLQLAPQASALHYPLAMSCREIGDRQCATHHFALRGDVSVPWDDPWLEELQPAVGRHRFVAAAMSAKAAGRHEEAVGLYRQALALDPDDPTALFGLANTYMQLGESREALALLERVLELDPDLAIAHYNVGTLLAQRREFTDALARLQRAVELAPNYSEARLNLGLAYLQLHRPVEARLELEGLVDSARDAVSEQAVIGEAELSLAQLALAAGETDEAIRRLERAVSRMPDRGDVRAELARLLFSSGDRAAALRQFERAVATAPTSEDAWFGGGLAMMIDDRSAAALEWLERGLGELPRSVALRHLLARLLACSAEDTVRDPERARELAEALVREAADYEHVQTLAMALAAAGSFEEAISWQDQVVSRARGEGRQELLAVAQQRLNLYRERRPVRSPWLP